MQQLYSIPQFCRIFSISRSEVYRQNKTGRLPFTKIGKATRIAIADADAWVSKLKPTEERNA